MSRPKRTRSPAGDGGPATLRLTRAAERNQSIDGTRRTIDALAAAGMDINQRNWESTRCGLEPPGCSWRTAQRPHCRPLLDEALGRKTRAVRPRHTSLKKRVADLEERLRKATACIHERDGEIAFLTRRCQDAEARADMLSKGTRARRVRRQQTHERHGLETGDANV